MLQALAEWVADVVHTLGYPGIALLLALENLIPPIPSELVLPLAGFLAGQGRFSLVLVIVAATLGSVLGALVLYALGRWLGEQRLRRFVQTTGRYLLLQESDLDKGLAWFERHGASAVLLGRLVPTIRSIVSVPAGIQRMPLWQFVLYTAAGSAAWNTVLTTLGWATGRQWEAVRDYAELVGYGVLLALGVAIVWFVVRRLKTRVS